MKKMNKILSVIIVAVMIVGVIPISAVAKSIQNVEWTGAMNYGTDNNADYTIGSLTPIEGDFTKEAWNVQVNTSTSNSGVYAGQPAIADDMLYITNGLGNLLKIDTATGNIIRQIDGIGATGWSAFAYDYLVIDKTNNLLFVIQSSKIQVVNLDTFVLVGDYATKATWNISSLGNYHPAQLHNGYLICNGYSFKINGNPSSSEKYLEAINTVTFGTDGTLKKNFAWSSGTFVNNLFYVTCTDTASASPTYKHVLLLAVDYTTGEVKHTFDAGLATDYAREDKQNASISSFNTTGQVVYDENTGYLYWSNRFCGYLFGVKVEEGGAFSSEMRTAALSKNSGTVCAPVIANGRLYIAGQGENWGQGGDVCVVNVDPNSSDFMKEIYATNTGIYKVQSNPLLFKDGTTSYIVIQSYVSPGYLYCLKDTPSTQNADLQLLATPSKGEVVALNSGTSAGGAYAFEQISKDDEGRIYAYNELGYLFCFENQKLQFQRLRKICLPIE